MPSTSACPRRRSSWSRTARARATRRSGWGRASAAGRARASSSSPGSSTCAARGRCSSARDWRWPPPPCSRTRCARSGRRRGSPSPAPWRRSSSRARTTGRREPPDVEPYYLLLLFGVTSLALYGAGIRSGLPARALRAAASRVLECAGLSILLLAVNLAAGFLLVLALRRLTGAFVSLYLNTDAVLAGMAVLQAIALQWWMEDP